MKRSIREDELQSLQAMLGSTSPESILLDEGAMESRQRFAAELVDCLQELASWIAVDAFLGASDKGASDQTRDQSPVMSERRSGFRAMALVTQMASELSSGAISCTIAGRLYASGALVRQLIECEYLLLAMKQDFKIASQWGSASQSELKKKFQPRHMRDVLGFDAAEYGQHCSIGGHPSPQGAQLLELERHMMELWTAVQGSKQNTRQLLTAEAQIDTVHHVDRCWKAAVGALEVHHACFPQDVPRVITLLARVRGARSRWEEQDLASSPKLGLALLLLVGQRVYEPG